MRIAGIQFSCSQDKNKNIDKALEFLDLAMDKGVSIVCFHEIFNLFWFPRERNGSFFDLADEPKSFLFKPFFERAKKYKVSILLPFFEKARHTYYNSCMVINGEGELVGIYRKVHLAQIPLWEEEYYFSRGSDFPVFSLGPVKIGIQLSWDNLYPEGTRILALKGAQIVFAPTACAFRTQNLWETVIKANAITNGLYIMRVNRVGSERQQDFYGMSFCVDPEGELISGPAAMYDSLIIAEIDLDHQKKVRDMWPLLKRRLPEAYSELIRGDY
ncbi:MAG: nitrilase-related carbon-nitrogen hydrolase [Deltaproteobacteria bacterium]|nr:nitrilase-related carbon-nitrogen hydrolase [Deltaproteobacteria bacterium]